MTKKPWITHFAMSKSYSFQPCDRDLTIKLFIIDLDQELKKAKKTDNIEIDCRWRNVGDAFNPNSKDYDPKIVKKYYYEVVPLKKQITLQGPCKIFTYKGAGPVTLKTSCQLCGNTIEKHKLILKK